MDWDIEVDVLCVGAGFAGRAMAVAAADAGDDVVVAEQRHADADDGLPSAPRSLLDLDVHDDETIRYLDALSADLRVTAPHGATPSAPMPVNDDLAPAPPRSRRIAPFVGARLRDWANGCLASSYGFLFTHVPGRGEVTMRSSRGDAFEVAAVGPLEQGPGPAPLVLEDWLRAQARSRDIEVSEDTVLLRLVFEEGRVVGAELATPSGLCAVRTWRGVVVSAAGRGGTVDVARLLPGGAPLYVSVVRQAPSRFGRVELVTNRPPSVAAHTRSPDWRRGELHRYPPIGE